MAVLSRIARLRSRLASARHMGSAFANVDVGGIAELFNRLAKVAPL